jgi:hypothetical protein
VPGIRLEWDGKASVVPRLRLPLQVIETVNAARDPGGGWRTGPQLQAYLDFVVTLYGAAPASEFQHLHGSKGRRAVRVGVIDTAVGLAEIKEALDEAVAAGHPGWTCWTCWAGSSRGACTSWCRMRPEHAESTSTAPDPPRGDGPAGR